MLNNIRCARGVTLLFALAACRATNVAAQSLTYVGGAQYATGSFTFGRRTWTANLSNGLSWSASRVRVLATLPLVIQDQRLVQYSAGGMMVPRGGMNAADSSGSSAGMMGSGMGGGMQGESMSGMAFGHVALGDPIGRVELALVSSGSDRTLSLVGAIKAPLAGRASGVGTGEWDAGSGLSTGLRVGQTFLFADAVYWRLGNPAGSSLRNAVIYDVSVGRTLRGGAWSVLGTVSGASQMWTGLPVPVQVGTSIGYSLGSGASLIGSAAAGLSRSAPTVTTGLGWRMPIGE